MTYNNKEEAEELMKDIMSGNFIKPPGGSVYNDLKDVEKGPPMLRMIVLQGIFAIAGKVKIAGPKVKILIILLVSLFFTFRDLTHFMKFRRPNIYE